MQRWHTDAVKSNVNWKAKMLSRRELKTNIAWQPLDKIPRERKIM